MLRKILMSFLLLTAVAFGAQAATFNYTWDKPVGFITTSTFVTAPKGFQKFCARHPDDCKPAQVDGYVILNADRMREMNTVNMDVNDSLYFNTDLAGKDNWDYPTDGYGDCEDYVIEKRKRLMDMGWPASALLITLAERKGETLDAWKNHAVLTVRTAQGDYILDNEIRPAVSWDKAARLYRFTAMQTRNNPVIWAMVAPSSTIH